MHFSEYFNSLPRLPPHNVLFAAAVYAECMQAKNLSAKYSSKRPSSGENDSQDTLRCPGEDKAFSTGAVSAAGGGGMTTVQTRRLGPSRMAVSLPASQRSALPRYQQEPPVRRRITLNSLWCVAEFDALRIRYSDHFPHS